MSDRQDSPATPGESTSTTEWSWAVCASVLTLIGERPKLRVRVAVGAMTFEIAHRSLEDLSKWLVAASTHAQRHVQTTVHEPAPVLVRFHPNGHCELGVEGIVKDPTWIRCKPLFVQGGDPLPFTLLIPAHVDSRGHPVTQRMIRL